MSIHISGNWISEIASVFESLFKSTIVHEIEDQLTKTIKDELPKQLDALVAEQGGISKIQDDLYADWSIPSKALITTNFIEVGVKGLMFDKSKGEIEPDVTAPVMPYHDNSEASQL
jgi:hypothetical protein